MPDIQTSLEYLKDLPLYGLEKPYYCLQPADDGLDPDEGGCHNLEFEIHTNIPIKDIRGYEDEYRLEDCGFEVLSYTSEVPNLESVDEIESPEVIAQYRADTERLLRAKLGACFVRCYDSILRKNVVFNRTRFDIRDPLHTEGPAQGAHNDVTYKSGPEIISRNMKAEEQEEFLRPGNRVRIVNTWRSILPVLEDRPLALCDSRSVEASDLVACDRIIPDRVGEVYYLKHNPNHKWYWLSGQTSTEPFAFVILSSRFFSQPTSTP
ncbi:hypothetical protein BKA64DRAFT_273918 [Cadophora sp. MPI-SDFR-AT-0126]|nr:hypothetical protein BKA64DRAFT_273918 [Leotiomycetes sp. MPI-SDFR-AT-0126]